MNQLDQWKMVLRWINQKLIKKLKTVFLFFLFLLLESNRSGELFVSSYFRETASFLDSTNRMVTKKNEWDLL